MIDQQVYSIYISEVSPFQSEQKEVRIEESSVASLTADVQDDSLRQGLASVTERAEITLEVSMKKSGEEAKELGDGMNASHPSLEVIETLAVLTFKSVAFLDLKSRSWETKALSHPIRNERNSAYTLLLDGSLFCCGGRWHDDKMDTYKTISAAAIIRKDGTVLPQPDLHRGRYSHGVASIGERVFVFGGKTDPACEQHSNEMYSDGHWTDLPNLSEPRWDFSPCMDKGLIYLSGGYNQTTEIFNPETLSFTIVYDLEVPYSSTVAVVEEGCLVVLTKSCIKKWAIESGNIETVDCVLEVNAICRPVVVEGLLYVLGYNGCSVIEMATGEQRDYIPYWKSKEISPNEEGSGQEIGRNHYRSILEVLKLCSPSIIISHLSFVNKHWSEASLSSELWRSFTEDCDPQWTRLSLIRKSTVSALLRDSVVFFNTETSQWRSKSLSRELGPGERNTFVILSDGTLFCCGGFAVRLDSNDCEFTYAISDAYIIKRDGAVLSQPHMHCDRYDHGLVALDETVFAFGGLTGCGRGDLSILQQSEMFVGGNWIYLPDMQKPRINVSTSVHKGLIYICGSNETTVEVFNPATLSFSLIPELNLIEDTAKIAVVYDGCLVILTDRTITRWDIEKKNQETENRYNHEPLLQYSGLGEVLVRGTLVGNLLYLLDFDKFNVIDVRTGELCDRFPLVVGLELTR